MRVEVRPQLVAELAAERVAALRAVDGRQPDGPPVSNRIMRLRTRR